MTFNKSSSIKKNNNFVSQNEKLNYLNSPENENFQGLKIDSQNISDNFMKIVNPKLKKEQIKPNISQVTEENEPSNSNEVIGFSKLYDINSQNNEK